MAPNDSRVNGPRGRGEDRLAPPEPEYRPTRAPDPVDTSMRNLALAAVAIAVVVMGGVYALSRHHPAGVPVIEPDSTPLRVKPANPGGMQVAGADDTTLNDTAGVEKDALAPPPEAPAPQALRQQTDAATATPPPPAATAPALAPLPPAPVPEAAPQPAPEPAPQTIAPPAARSTPPASSGTQVQLAALDSQQAAQAAWAQLTRRLPHLLAGHTPSISRTERDGHVYWRLRTGGFADIAAATAFCTQVRAQGGGCAIASF